ncbi:MAG: B12-binding domain-containing radical SAM protein [Desulfosalsimonadaceae bacterium]
MRALLIYPKFPKSFWSFEKALALTNRKAVIPPLGLITVAALLPGKWEKRLKDHNIETIDEEDWQWAEIILLSGMIAQKPDFIEVIQQAKKRGKPIAVGGPYPTALPDEARSAGADFLVLDEGEMTIPMFLEAINQGETKGIFRSEIKPDITQTPIPLFELLNMDAYAEMAVQFSRGCPYNCEFCDIIVLYGRTPRAKRPAQMLAELSRLYELGWRSSVFLVDDNFIGNKRKVKQFLKELKPWMNEHAFPFKFGTEASVDLAKDQELMDLMTSCKFGSVFLGIETPDVASLNQIGKHQNVRISLDEAIHSITTSGLRVMAGFIVGFDNEAKGAGQRIVDFVTRSSIPVAYFSMLHALPHTALWHRLKREGRLKERGGDCNQTTLMNFIPTRPMDEIVSEYVEGFWRLYDPKAFLKRAYQHYLLLGQAACHQQESQTVKSKLNKKRDFLIWKGFATILWRQGIWGEGRTVFWKYLWGVWHNNPGGVIGYLSLVAQLEHFLDYRKTIKRELLHQLADFE